jgi:Na+-driven multidrug efflux pump
MNIATTLNNLASVVFLSMGNTVGIIIGQMLGAGKSAEEVRDADNKLIAVAIGSCLVFGGLMAACGHLFPQLYNTTDDVRWIATRIIWICAAFMPIHSYCNATYFTLRSGGQTMVTFLFDSCYVWVCSVPLAFCLSRFTDMPIVWLYLACSCMDFVKCGIGNYMLRRGTWIQNLSKAE